MGLYNFEKRFVPFILAGTKKHTIRAKRANPDKPGNTLHLYTGLRHKGAKLIMRVRCVKVETIKIAVIEKFGIRMERPVAIVSIDGMLLDASECESLAQRDGFKDFAEMLHYWKSSKNCLPFEGHIIHWR
jgi:hypothetical protein